MVGINKTRGSLGVFSFPMSVPRPLSQSSSLTSVPATRDSSLGLRSCIDTAVNTSYSGIPTHNCRRLTNRNPLDPELCESTSYMGRRVSDSSSLTDFLIPYRSEKGRELLIDCLRSDANENYMSLSEQFLTQSSPPSCGVATLAMVLNSLRIDPGRVWRKPWRWFTEETLISCFPLEKSEQELGLTMEHFGLIAECNGATAQTFYGSSTTIDEFRRCLDATFSPASWERRIVVAFDRSVLGQTGTGHYSPIGAYHAESDMVLVLDVARFKYPPYWVPVEQMWEAMRTVDPESKRSRGFFIMSRSPTGYDARTNASKIESPHLANVISALMDPKADSLKLIAADLVHGVRKRILSCSCIGKTCETLIDCSSYQQGDALLQEIRLEPSLKTCLSIDQVLQVGCKSEAEMRPIDFFIQSMPQFVHELVTLMIIEQGPLFIGDNSLNALLYQNSA